MVAIERYMNSSRDRGSGGSKTLRHGRLQIRSGIGHSYSININK